MFSYVHPQLRRSLLFNIISIMMFIATEARADGPVGYSGEVGSLTNDYFGDGHDRWRTGSYQRSYLSDRFDTVGLGVIELRARSEIITPWKPSEQPDGDAPFSTLLGFGGFMHGSLATIDLRLGAELLLLGDATGLENIQSIAHEIIGVETSFDDKRDEMPRGENGLSARAELEVSKSIRFGTSSLARPYVGLKFGADESATLGVDLVTGSLALADIWTRDAVTGRLITPQADRLSGVSVVGGWDMSQVERSVHIPSGSSATIETFQTRARLGVQFETGIANLFIGQAWLSPQFKDQAEGQRVGMLSVAFDF